MIDSLITETKALKRHIDEAMDRLAIHQKKAQLSELESQLADPNVWSDNQRAQAMSKQQSKLEQLVVPWQALLDQTEELVGLCQLEDESLADEIATSLEQAQTQYESLKQQLRFTGQYDDSDIILSIYAGAGGTDAQDWAEMLLRMYARWAERENVSVDMIQESRGDEAGIKSATLTMSGSYVYGRLKGEHGVHRLVRQSPFNSDSLRQTSFAKVEVIPRIETPEDVEIDEGDIKIDVYRSGGKGGQSVNTTDSAVRVSHLPTGISVAIQNERSQIQNKETAMTILRSRLLQLQIEQHKETVADLKGPDTANEWGSQIRNYVLHPYKQVKDVRTKHESSDPNAVLEGDINEFIDAYLDATIGE